MTIGKNAKRSVVNAHICNRGTKRKAMMAAVAAASAATPFYHTANLQAATYTWTGSTDTSYNASYNWNTSVVAGSADYAGFGTTVTPNQPVLTAGSLVDGLIFGSTTGGWDIGNGTTGSLQINNGGINDTANTSGTDTITANVNMGPHISGGTDGNGVQTWAPGVGGTLALTGSLLVNDNETLTVNNGTVTWGNWSDDTLGSVSAGLLILSGGTGTLAIMGASSQGAFQMNSAGTISLTNGEGLSPIPFNGASEKSSLQP
jgi:hypothetical protein